MMMPMGMHVAVSHFLRGRGAQANNFYIKVKFFAGYAGWSPGQLDDEMKADAWLTHPASLELVFHRQPEKLWKTVLCEMGPAYRLLAEMPEDVSRN